MRWMVCTALACSCAVASMARQSERAPAHSKEPPPGILGSVSVTGNHLYSSQDIVKQSGLRIGQRISGPQIEQARAKIQATELFNSVADHYRFSGTPLKYAVTFEVVENQQLFPIRFDRLGVPDDALRQYLRDHVEMYSDRIPGTAGVVRRYTAAVQDFINKSNPSLKVKSIVDNDQSQQLAVIFEPNTPPPTISQVQVSGNEAVDTGTILRAVNQVAVGAPISDLRLKRILEGAIRPLYAAKGYAAVTFPKIETVPSPSNLGVIVKIQINDGPQFKFGAIHFRGSGLDEDDIRSSIPFKPGQTFNGNQVENFRLELTHQMRHRGLLDASITVDTEPQKVNRLVDVTYNIVPGAVYNFQRLDIQGLDITTEPVIARLWGEKAGHPFNPDYPDFFLKRVKEEGLFDNLADTHSDYTADASTHNVTVHLYFKGGKSREALDKEKKEEQERQKSDGSWSPYPY